MIGLQLLDQGPNIPPSFSSGEEQRKSKTGTNKFQWPYVRTSTSNLELQYSVPIAYGSWGSRPTLSSGSYPRGSVFGSQGSLAYISCCMPGLFYLQLPYGSLLWILLPADWSLWVVFPHMVLWSSSTAAFIPFNSHLLCWGFQLCIPALANQPFNWRWVIALFINSLVSAAVWGLYTHILWALNRPGTIGLGWSAPWKAVL